VPFLASTKPCKLPPLANSMRMWRVGTGGAKALRGGAVSSQAWWYRVMLACVADSRRCTSRRIDRSDGVESPTGTARGRKRQDGAES